MESFDETWELICNFCKNKITDVAYKTWISRIQPLDLNFDDGIITVLVPNEFHKKTVAKCYLGLLQNASYEVFGKDFDFVLKAPEEKPSKDQKLALNSPDFTFETFIVGSSNKFAHAAAMAVAATPAESYNPLFIYGNSGLGKTHLLYAIYNDIKDKKSDLSVLYIKGDDFTNELIDSIRKNATLEFHEKYRNVDVLFVDDIQFIAGKDSTQEEFFHTFNSLYESKKQIVLTSDRPPKEIQTLENRLRSRFEWGLIADIQPPDFETRIAIIKRKAEDLNIRLPSDVCEYVAKKLKANIRQLEGAVKKIKAHHYLGGEKVNIATAQTAIESILNNNQPLPITIEKITEEVAKTFEIQAADIKSSKRSGAISKARQIAIYVTREATQMQLSAIGKEFGGRDHSTIVYTINQIEKTMKENPKTKALIEDIIRNIRSMQ